MTLAITTWPAQIGDRLVSFSGIQREFNWKQVYFGRVNMGILVALDKKKYPVTTFSTLESTVVALHAPSRRNNRKALDMPIIGDENHNGLALGGAFCDSYGCPPPETSEKF